MFFDSKLTALSSASSEAQLEAALKPLQNIEGYFIGQVRDILLQKQFLIRNSSSVGVVADFLQQFANSKQTTLLLQTPDVYNMIIFNLCPKATASTAPLIVRAIKALTDSPTSLFSTREAADALIFLLGQSNVESWSLIYPCITDIIKHSPSASPFYVTPSSVSAFSSIITTNTHSIRISNFVDWMLGLFQAEFSSEHIANESFLKTLIDAEAQSESTESKAALRRAIDFVHDAINCRILKSVTDAKSFCDAIRKIYNADVLVKSANVINVLLQKQFLIHDDAGVDFTCWFLAEFGSTPDGRSILANSKRVHDMLIFNLAPKVTSMSLANFAYAMFQITFDESNHFAAAPAANALLRLFSIVNEVSAAKSLVTAVFNIITHSPAAAVPHFVTPTAVAAFLAIIPRLTNDDSVRWMSKLILKIIEVDPASKLTFAKPEFFNACKEMEKFAVSDETRKKSREVSYCISFDTVSAALMNAKEARDVRAAVANLPHTDSFFIASIRDALLSKAGFIQGDRAVCEVADFLKAFSANAKSVSLLRTPTIYKFIFESLARYVAQSDSVESVATLISNLIVDNETTAHLVGVKARSGTNALLRFAGTANSVNAACLALHNIIVNAPPSTSKEIRSQFIHVTFVDAVEKIVKNITSALAVKCLTKALLLLVEDQEAKELFSTFSFVGHLKSCCDRASRSLSSVAAGWEQERLLIILETEAPIQSLIAAKTGREFSNAAAALAVEKHFTERVMQEIVKRAPSMIESDNDAEGVCEYFEQLMHREALCSIALCDEVRDLFVDVLMPLAAAKSFPLLTSPLWNLSYYKNDFFLDPKAVKEIFRLFHLVADDDQAYSVLKPIEFMLRAVPKDAMEYHYSCEDVAVPAFAAVAHRCTSEKSVRKLCDVLKIIFKRHGAHFVSFRQQPFVDRMKALRSVVEKSEEHSKVLEEVITTLGTTTIAPDTHFFAAKSLDKYAVGFNFRSAIERLLNWDVVPVGRPDLASLIPSPGTAEKVIAAVELRLSEFKWENIFFVHQLELSNDHLRALLAFNLSPSTYPVARWLNGHLESPTGTESDFHVGPFFALLQRAMELLPRESIGKSYAVIPGRSVPAYRLRFEHSVRISQGLPRLITFFANEAAARREYHGGDGAKSREPVILLRSASGKGVDMTRFADKNSANKNEKHVVPFCPFRFGAEKCCKHKNGTDFFVKIVDLGDANVLDAVRGLYVAAVHENETFNAACYRACRWIRTNPITFVVILFLLWKFWMWIVS